MRELEPTLAPPQRLVACALASFVDAGAQHSCSTFGGRVCFSRHALVGCRLALGTGAQAGADLGTAAAPCCLCLGLLHRRWCPPPMLYVRQMRVLWWAHPCGASAGLRNERTSLCKWVCGGFREHSCMPGSCLGRPAPPTLLRPPLVHAASPPLHLLLSACCLLFCY